MKLPEEATLAGQIKKYGPGVTALAIVFSLLGYFVRENSQKDTRQRSDCIEQVKEANERADRAEARASAAEAETKQVYRALAVQTGALKEVQTELKKTTDSVVSEKIIKPLNK